VHDLEVGGTHNQATANEVNQLHPGIAYKEEWPRVTHLQQIPGDGDLGESADAAIEANEEIGL
jgi:hypothetical protein